MTLEESIENSIRTIQALSKQKPAIDEAAQIILKTLREGGKILTAGNGGSAAEASHFATELVGRYAAKRRSLPSLALAADGSLITCIGNDFGFDQIFARQVAGLATAGDLLVVFTSSGNSANIVAALSQARSQGIASLAFLGKGGGQCAGVAQIELIVPGTGGATAQEAHLFLIHYFCELIDAQFR